MRRHFLAREEGFSQHILEWEPAVATEKLPLLCVHGNLSNAKWFEWIGEELASGRNSPARRVLAPDLRGRGDSGLPAEGCSLRHMASDIEAVLEHFGLEAVHVLAYSRGLAYALEFARRYPGRISGLVVGDFPPVHSRLPEQWAEQNEAAYADFPSWEAVYAADAGLYSSREEFERQKERAYRVCENGFIRKRYDRRLPRRLQQDSEDVELAPALAAVRGPLLVLKGEDELGSALSEPERAVYEPYPPAWIRVRGVGHNVVDPLPQFREALCAFFSELD